MRQDTNVMRLTEKFVELYHNAVSHAYISHTVLCFNQNTNTLAHTSALKPPTSIIMYGICGNVEFDFIFVFFLFFFSSLRTQREKEKKEKRRAQQK